MQQTTCNRQHATDNMQLEACYRQHATYSRLHATDSMRNTTCDNMQYATRNRQHVTLRSANMQPVAHKRAAGAQLLPGGSRVLSEPRLMRTAHGASATVGASVARRPLVGCIVASLAAARVRWRMLYVVWCTVHTCALAGARVCTSVVSRRMVGCTCVACDTQRRGNVHAFRLLLHGISCCNMVGLRRVYCSVEYVTWTVVRGGAAFRSGKRRRLRR